MTINSAQPQLLELAEAMRGPDWAGDLGAALVAAKYAGWDWPKVFLFAARLLADEDAHPRDLTEAVRDPLRRNPGNDPAAYDRGGALAHDLLAEKAAARQDGAA